MPNEINETIAIGDRVRFIKPYHPEHNGEIYSVISVNGGWIGIDDGCCDEVGGYRNDRLVKVEMTENPPSFDPEWDERARGPRMSEVEGLTIHKYQIPILERFVMRLPHGAEIIRIADQGGMLWMWCVVDTRAPCEERRFHAYKTGAAIDPEASLKYIGCGAIHIQAELALYIFEVLP